MAYTEHGLARRNAFTLATGAPTGIVDTFILFGSEAPSAKHRKGWPLYRASILDNHNIVIDQRESWNDCELVRWIESFGFVVEDYDILSCLPA